MFGRRSAPISSLAVGARRTSSPLGGEEEEVPLPWGPRRSKRIVLLPLP